MCFLFCKPDHVCPFCESESYCSEHEMERKHLHRVSMRDEMEELSELSDIAEYIEYYLEQLYLL
jgi:hypothetical protein